MEPSTALSSVMDAGAVDGLPYTTEPSSNAARVQGFLAMDQMETSGD